MSRWGIRYGRWWAIQWMLGPWLSIGVHVDGGRHVDSHGRRFGPYVDIHLISLIVSFGVGPAYSGELERALSISRGGLTD